MKRQASLLALDFAAPARRAPLAGVALCIAGCAAVLSVGLAFDGALAERDLLEARLGAAAPPRRSPPSPDSLKVSAEAAGIERELAIPWTRLLAELEAAGKDSATSVFLLQIEPDPAKHLVRITAEVRTLPDAFSFLKRLQKSGVLRHPMLDSHERRKDDPEHPLRIKLSAEWGA